MKRNFVLGNVNLRFKIETILIEIKFADIDSRKAKVLTKNLLIYSKISYFVNEQITDIPLTSS